MSLEITAEIPTCAVCKNGNHYWCLSRYGVRCACYELFLERGKTSHPEQQKAEVKAQ